MGLDVVNTCKESLLHIVKENCTKVSVPEKIKDYSELIKEIEIAESSCNEYCTDCSYSRFLSLLKSTLNPDKYSEEKERQIEEKYLFILEDNELSSLSRIGSYGVIHYLRTFAQRLYEFLKEDDIDMFRKERDYKKITEKECLELVKMVLDDRCNYELFPFTNLNGHSDCDGYYVPKFKRINFDIASSFGLFEELDAIYDTNAINCLMNYMKKFDKEKNVHKEDKKSCWAYYDAEFYWTCYNIVWAWKKLMYCALDSILYGTVIEFC